MPSCVRAGIRKCARFRTLSSVVSEGLYTSVRHRVEYFGRLLRDEPVESDLKHVLIDLPNFPDVVPSSFYEWKTVRRTQACLYARIESPKYARTRTLSMFTSGTQILYNVFSTVDNARILAHFRIPALT